MTATEKMRIKWLRKVSDDYYKTLNDHSKDEMYATDREFAATGIEGLLEWLDPKELTPQETIEALNKRVAELDRMMAEAYLPNVAAPGHSASIINRLMEKWSVSVGEDRTLYADAVEALRKAVPHNSLAAAPAGQVKWTAADEHRLDTTLHETFGTPAPAAGTAVQMPELPQPLATVDAWVTRDYGRKTGNETLEANGEYFSRDQVIEHAAAYGNARAEEAVRETKKINQSSTFGSTFGRMYGTIGHVVGGNQNLVSAMAVALLSEADLANERAITVDFEARNGLSALRSGTFGKMASPPVEETLYHAANVGKTVAAVLERRITLDIESSLTEIHFAVPIVLDFAAAKREFTEPDGGVHQDWYPFVYQALMDVWHYNLPLRVFEMPWRDVRHHFEGMVPHIDAALFDMRVRRHVRNHIFGGKK